MKTIFAVVFLLSTLQLRAQFFNNTEWTQIKPGAAENTVSGQTKNTPLRKYFFKEKTVLIAVGNSYTGELDFTVADTILSIGKYIKFNIDTVDNDVLMLSEFSNKKTVKNKTAPEIFLHHNSIFGYLKETNQLKITGDSLIEYNVQLYPTLYTGLDSLFSYEVASKTMKKDLFGGFTINPSGKITDVYFDLEKSISPVDIENFKRTINSTSGLWVLPVTEKPYYFKINFRLYYTYISSVSGVSFSFPAN